MDYVKALEECILALREIADRVEAYQRSGDPAVPERLRHTDAGDLADAAHAARAVANKMSP